MGAIAFMKFFAEKQFCFRQVIKKTLIRRMRR